MPLALLFVFLTLIPGVSSADKGCERNVSFNAISVPTGTMPALLDKVLDLHWTYPGNTFFSHSKNEASISCIREPGFLSVPPTKINFQNIAECLAFIRAIQGHGLTEPGETNPDTAFAAWFGISCPSGKVENNFGY